MPTRPLRVLLVEDRPDDAELILHLLRQSGYEPEWQRVDSEPDYLNHLRPTLDLILSDHDLPLFDLGRALQRLQERELDIPFIIVSGSIGEDAAVAALKQGAADYLLKDRLARLGEAVRHALEQKQLRDEQRAANHALHESAAYFRTLIEHSADIIAVTDAKGVLTYISPSVERVLGFQPDALIGQSAFTLLHPDDLEAARTMQPPRDGEQRGVPPQEFRVWHKDGTLRVLEVVVNNQLDNPSVQGFTLNARDISERKQSEARYQRVVEDQSDLICRYDTQFRLTFVNRAFADLYQRRPEALIGMSLIDVVPEDIRDSTRAHLMSLSAANPIHVYEAPERMLDNTVHWLQWTDRALLDETGHIVEYQGVGHDFTKLKQVEEELMRYRDHLENLVEQRTTELNDAILELKERERKLRYHASLQATVTDAVISTDLDFHIQSWNPAAERLYGWRAEEVIGRVSQEVLQTQSLTGLAREDTVRAFMEVGHWTGEVKQRHREGTVLDILGSTALFKDENGHPIGVVAVNRDITERKRAEEALRESEEKFRLLMEGAPQAIVISDEAGIISLVNAQAEKDFGYSRDELMGQSIEILVMEETRAKHRHLRTTYGEMPHSRPTGSIPAVPARRKDGTQFSAEIGLSYIESKTGLLVINFIADMTEREQNAAALEEQRTFLRKVIDVSPSLIFVKDYDARFVLANPLVAQMYNTTPEDLIGKSDADFNPSAEEVEYYLQADREVIASGEPHFFEEPITSFTGETHWLQTTKVPIVSADGKSKYVLGVATDITERKQAEITLREQHEFLHQVINNVPGLIIVKDAAGRFLLVNNREAELFGSTPADMLGKTDADFNPNQAEVSFFKEKDREALETGQTIFIPEETVFSRYYQTTKVPLKNHDGKHDRLLVVASDITERKQAELALRQAFEKEKELSELKSRFTSMVSLEFRTPLAILMSSTDLLMLHGSRMDDAKKQERFAKIQQQVRRMIDLLDETLAITKAETVGLEFNPQALNIRDFCAALINEFQATSPYHRIEFNSSGEMFDGLFDPKLMHQIITNLLSNAVKYSPQSDHVKLKLVSQDAEVRIAVQDYGIGMSEDDLAHLFEPFFRGKNVGLIPGTGLGLPIVRHAVEAQGGSIHAASELNLGTTFIIHLPLSQSS